jgi:dTDP-4-dehydrorhamnose 3,5-epimerase
MKIVDTPLAGLSRVALTPHADARGTFTRWFCERELTSLLDGRRIVQANHSRTEQRGTVRGLHYQVPPHAEMKLLRCIRGRVFDVAVDLRSDSATFLQWQSFELSDRDPEMLVIPEGFAHGFQVLEAGAELLYLHTAEYVPESERGLRFDDPELGIPWPLPLEGVSGRDLAHPLISKSFTGISLD